MALSADTIGMIIALFAFMVSLGGGMGAAFSHLSKRLDARFDHVDARFDQVDARFAQVDARFDQVDARLDRMDARMDRMDLRFDRMDGRMDRLEQGQAALEHELVEVKVAIARWEGPPRRLQHL